jgi:hypothetical protein
MRPTQETSAVATALLAAAALVGFGGRFAGAYGRLWPYADVAHGLSAFAVTFVVACSLSRRTLTGADEHVVLLTTLVAIGLGGGAASELGEFAFDHGWAAGNVIQGKFDR